jgi:hypothetical protein
MADRSSIGESFRPSNGEMGDWFVGKWCVRCAKDRDNGGTCDIMNVAWWKDKDHLEYPQELKCSYDGGFDAWCTAFNAAEFRKGKK